MNDMDLTIDPNTAHTFAGRQQGACMQDHIHREHEINLIVDAELHEVVSLLNKDALTRDIAAGGCKLSSGNAELNKNSSTRGTRPYTKRAKRAKTKLQRDQIKAQPAVTNKDETR